MQTRELIGRGLSFPIRITNGSVELSDYQELIENSIKLILSWNIGTRFFNPNFGSRLWQLLGEQNDQVLRSLVKTFVIEALSSNEQRITLLEAAISTVSSQQIAISLTYKIKGIAELKVLEYSYSPGYAH